METDQKFKVLYVEDGKMYRDTTELILGKDKHPYNFEMASDVDKGLEKITKNNYNVVITDGVLDTSLEEKEAMKQGGLRIAKAAKAKGAYTIGFSSTSEKFNDVANKYLDSNLDKINGTLMELVDEVYKALDLEEDN